MYYLLVPVCYTSICNRISSSLSPRIVDSELVQQLFFFPSGKQTWAVFKSSAGWWWMISMIPSGKRLHSYGKSPCLMGKSTISMAMFNSYFDITRGYLMYVFRLCQTIMDDHNPWESNGPTSLMEWLTRGFFHTRLTRHFSVRKGALNEKFHEMFDGTLWWCQNSYWKWPFIVDFPIQNGDFP